MQQAPEIGRLPFLSCLRFHTFLPRPLLHTWLHVLAVRLHIAAARLRQDHVVPGMEGYDKANLHLSDSKSSVIVCPDNVMSST